MTTRLSRSRTDNVLGGVCGGLARYLGLDPALVRLVAVVLALGDGIGVMLYLVLWIVVPLEGEDAVTQTIPRNSASEITDRARSLGNGMSHALNSASPRATLLIGGALIVMGAVFLLQQLDLPWLRWLSFDQLWPALLIAGGLGLLWRRAFQPEGAR
jgi:phage shock protein C